MEGTNRAEGANGVDGAVEEVVLEAVVASKGLADTRAAGVAREASTVAEETL